MNEAEVDMANKIGKAWKTGCTDVAWHSQVLHHGISRFAYMDDIMTGNYQIMLEHHDGIPHTGNLWLVIGTSKLTLE